MSEVTICNLALANLGDTATVASIKPPDSSVQAQLCARFYPVARDALLEMASWGFATRRICLAELCPDVQPCGCTEETEQPCGNCQAKALLGRGPWGHVYAMPSDAINVIAVIPKCAPDDYQAWFGPVDADGAPFYPQGYQPVPGAPRIVPQPFSCESLADGTQVILTNVCDAMLRYTTVVTDTTKFSPLFTLSLSWLLSSMLAGPLIKGAAGAVAAKSALGMFGQFKGQATASDANQRKINVEPAVGWIRGR